MKKLNNWIFSIFVFLFTFFVIYSYRSIFLTQYDNNYLRDLYDHSQWNMAISKRPVNDNIVYKVTGYDLVKNWSYFTIDPQTPVLGKYLYGYSILLFNNAEIASIFVFIITLIAFYILSKKILKNQLLTQVSLLLFITEPIIFYQTSQSMLDLPQLLFLICHVISVLKLGESSGKTKSFFWTLLAGLTLGGFVSLKIGFFSSAIILADVIYLFKKKKLIHIIPIALFSLATYIITYIPYFFQNHTLLDFLKAQKWIIVSYWLSSKSKPLVGMLLVSLFTGFIKGWFQGSSWERVKEWSIFWPIYGYIFIKLVLNKKNYLDTDKLYLICLSLSLGLLYLIVPFYARYLVLIIPFLIILSADFITKLNYTALKLIILVFIIQIIFFLFPGPQDMLVTSEQIWKNSAYQDLYSFIDKNSLKKISRNDFWRQGLLLEKNLEIMDKKVHISIPILVFPWNNYSISNIEITYSTPLGNVINKKRLNLIRKDNTWKIVWRDNLLLSDFDFGDKIIFRHDYGKYGKLISKNGKILTQAELWPVFFIIHQKIKDESIVQNQLIKLTGLKKHDIEYLYKANMPSDWETKIGILKTQLSPTILTAIKLDPAVSIKYQNLRVHNQEFLIKYPSLDPVLGGEILLKKKNSIKTIIKRDKVDGKDIVL